MYLSSTFRVLQHCSYQVLRRKLSPRFLKRILVMYSVLILHNCHPIKHVFIWGKIVKFLSKNAYTVKTRVLTRRDETYRQYQCHKLGDQPTLNFQSSTLAMIFGSCFKRSLILITMNFMSSLDCLHQNLTWYYLLIIREIVF